MQRCHPHRPPHTRAGVGWRRTSTAATRLAPIAVRRALPPATQPAPPPPSSSSSPPPPPAAAAPPPPPQQPLTFVETSARSRTTTTWGGADSPQQQQQNGGVLPAPLLDSPQQQPQHALSARWRSLQESARDLFLPAGYPSSVTDDYLAYQLATVPAHITGWLSISLTTSSLLKAVGISAGPVGATAAAAAIKWIVKDGIGAAGRFLVGGRLGVEFDDDPRRWRMMAEGLTTLGLALEVATAIYPQQFLLLASVGNFSKAVGKGMGRPVFRVVQTHFAAAGNVGAVAAKEEVWEVSAQLTGYLLSVLVLNELQDAGSWQTVVGLWALVQGAHVALRYLALSKLRFRYINHKRAKLLVSAHARGQQLPSVAAGNAAEPMLSTAADMAPRAHLGCSVAHAWGVDSPAQVPPPQLAAWWGLYEREGYLLTWRAGQAYVVVKQQQQQQLQSQVQQQGEPQVLLRALWQAAWLDAYSGSRLLAQQQQQQHLSRSGGDQQQQQTELGLLSASLQALEQQFDGFVDAARAAGWRTDQVVLRAGPHRLQAYGGGGAGAGGVIGASSSDGEDLADLDK